MTKDGSKAIYGVLGYPVKHSLSPLMHNAAFCALDINAEYKAFEVAPEEIEGFLKDLDKSGICGLNITVPYKEKVLNYVELDRQSFYLKQVRAVNTMVKKNNSWKGFNTDIPGFEKHLKENFEPANKKAAIIGAGGAARAVSYVLAKLGAAETAVFDIDKTKARNLSDMIKSLFPDFQMSIATGIRDLEIRDKALLVNATPVGLKGSDPCLIEEKMLHKGLFVYDLIYNPAETKLLSMAKKVGAKTANGLGMLLYQGALSFGHFTGVSAPIQIMSRALNEGVGKI